jgi:hypothetical protein
MTGIMLRPSMRMRLCSAVLAAAVLFGPSPRAAQPTSLRRLGGIDELKSWFNANQGHARALFLLSPT